jgi:hypothetical protein
MKRRVQVTIDVDTEEPGGTYFQDSVSGDTDRFLIYVRADSPSPGIKNPAVIGLAHECGHMIGEIFRLPGQAQDPRSHDTEPPTGRTHGERVYQCEVEAWDLAEMVLSFDTDRRECLDTYARRGFKPALTYKEVR